MVKASFVFLIICLVNVSLLAQAVDTQNGSFRTQAVDVSKIKNPEQVRIRVWIESAKPTDPPLAGTTLVKGDAIVFEPRFPVLAGKYRVEIQVEPNQSPLKLIWEINAEGKPVTEVEAVFPSAGTIPENTLKFYIQFSAPMRKGDIYQFVKLRERGGKDIEIPFLEIEQEFWSRDAKRLTLLLDPGRIKRGLKPREEMGPIFEAGKTYELVVSGNWPDADGGKLGAGSDHVHAFKTSKEDHEQPSLSNWTVTSPKADSKSPLGIQFPESLDRAMLLRSIQVFRMGEEQPIAGQVKISKQETVWSLVVKEPWAVGEYRIEVNATLEDLCGNSIERQFDVDVFQKTEPVADGKKAQLKFQIER